MEEMRRHKLERDREYFLTHFTTPTSSLFAFAKQLLIEIASSTMKMPLSSQSAVIRKPCCESAEKYEMLLQLAA